MSKTQFSILPLKLQDVAVELKKSLKAVSNTKFRKIIAIISKKKYYGE